jgi:dTDP-D-glucose 4,6-dehydratase
MKMLVLGSSVFIGKHLMRSVLRGHNWDAVLNVSGFVMIEQT